MKHLSIAACLTAVAVLATPTVAFACDTDEQTFRTEVLAGDLRNDAYRPLARRLLALRKAAEELNALGQTDACREVMDAVGEIASQPPANVALTSVVDMEGSVKVSQIMNAELRSSDDKDLGTINNVILDGTWKPAYVVAEHGGFLGFGEEEVVIPFKTLQLSPSGTSVFLPIPAKQFENAPRFKRNAFDWQKDRSWQNRVDGFYRPVSQQSEAETTSGARKPAQATSAETAQNQTTTKAGQTKKSEAGTKAETTQ
ncbi:MAG: PRC-barrel domain-containing protein [Pseudomonadota bacterium]